jgi:two-component system sensor histidine kinase KdpD
LLGRSADYLRACAITCLCTAIGFPLSPHIDPINLVMIYLLGSTVAGLYLSRPASAFNAVTNMLAFDYFFVPPAFSFEVEDTQYLFSLVVMLFVAIVIANLMVTIRRNSRMAEAREQRTALLYAMSRELAVANDLEAIVAVAIRHIAAVFRSQALVLLADDQGRLESPKQPNDAIDLGVAEDVAARGVRALKDGIYLPLHGGRRNMGVLVVRAEPSEPNLSAEKSLLLDNFATQLALALERAQLAEAAEAARFAAERAALRNTLLTSISHDLRTPLAAIAGAGSLIAQPDYALNADRRTTLGHLIERKARDMSQLLSNVLELMRMEFATGNLRTDWHAIEDLVALALRSHVGRLGARRLVVDLPPDLPEILVDATLIVQILDNLLENAAKYTPLATTVTISASSRVGSVVLAVCDDGPGLPPGDPERLFEKFQRGRAESNVVGVGLGLAICRAAARLHGGDIRAGNNPGGGARFEITLPMLSQVDALPSPEFVS